MYDLIFLSYDEPQANENYENLVSRFSHAKRIHGVEGIVQAHKEAAKISLTEYFWVVDGDNIIQEDFDFSFKWEKPRDGLIKVCVWGSVNSVNGLKYGNGGVKLLPKYPVLSYPMERFEDRLDFSTTIGGVFHYEKTCASINRFNTSEFHSWRAAFREVFKLRSKMDLPMDKQQYKDIRKWIAVWLTEGKEAEYGDFVIQGASDAIDWYKSNPRNTERINDFYFLREVWDKKYGH